MELKSISFTIPGEIKTKDRPRARVCGGYAQIYTSKKTLVYENRIRSIYENSGRIFFGDSPLEVIITAYFTPSKAIEKYVEYGLECVVHKDLDNIAKTVLDALNGIAYKDDKQVYKLNISKKYLSSSSDQEFIEVTIFESESNIERAKALYKVSEINKKLDKLSLKAKLSNKERIRYQKLEQEKLSILNSIDYLPF